jgi:hypothetical protein
VDWGVFDAIYLINLPERTDRKRELEREIISVGLRTDDPRLVWIRAVRPMEAGEFPSIGARGCFLSHLTCLQSASEHGHTRVLILEDDACFPKLLVDDLKGVVGGLKSLNWAIWYGGASMLNDPRVSSRKVVTIPIAHTVGVQTAHCVAFQGETIQSIRTFLELILTRTNGHPEAGPMHVDGAYSTWRALNPTAVTLVTVPSVCIQRSSRTDIGRTGWLDTTPLVRRSMAAVRRLRNRLRYGK